MPVAVEIPEKRVPSSSNKKLISISFDDSFLQRISVSDEEDGKSISFCNFKVQKKKDFCQVHQRQL